MAGRIWDTEEQVTLSSCGYVRPLQQLHDSSRPVRLRRLREGELTVTKCEMKARFVRQIAKKSQEWGQGIRSIVKVFVKERK
jgi:hypothetical protein